VVLTRGVAPAGGRERGAIARGPVPAALPLTPAAPILPGHAVAPLSDAGGICVGAWRTWVYGGARRGARAGE